MLFENSLPVQLRNSETEKCYVRRILEYMEELAQHPGFHQFAWEDWIKRLEKKKFGLKLIEKLRSGDIIDDFDLTLNSMDEDLLARCGVSQTDIELCLIWKDDILLNGDLSKNLFIDHPESILESFIELMMDVPERLSGMIQIQPVLENRFIELEEYCSVLTKRKHDPCYHAIEHICEERGVPSEIFAIIYDMINFQTSVPEPDDDVGYTRQLELPLYFCELLGVELEYSFKDEPSSDTKSHTVDIELYWRGPTSYQSTTFGPVCYEFRSNSSFVCLPNTRYYIPLGWSKMEAFRMGNAKLSSFFFGEPRDSPYVSVRVPFDATLEDVIIWHR